MAYKYMYKGKDYLWYKLKRLEDFKNVSFPDKEEAMSLEVLGSLEITRYEYIVPVPEPPSLEKIKERKINELKRERNQKEKEPIEVTGLGLFDFDDNSRSRINGAMTVLEGTETKLEWTLADNTSVEVGYNDLKSVVVAGGVRCNMLHTKYRELRDMVNACTTKEEVAEISWEIINNVQ